MVSLLSPGQPLQALGSPRPSAAVTRLLSFLRTDSHAPGAQDGLEGAVHFSDQKAPGKLERGFSVHPPFLYPTPSHPWMEPLMASYPLEASSEAGSDMFSEPVTVSCGLCSPLWAGVLAVVWGEVEASALRGRTRRPLSGPE